MKEKTKIAYLTVIGLVLVFTLVSFAALAKNSNAQNGNSGGNKNAKNQSDKGNKNNSGQKNIKHYDIYNFTQPDKSKGLTNADLHMQKSVEVTTNLEAVAEDEKADGDTAISNQVQQVVNEQTQTQTETVDAISQVESRNPLKTILLGADFKNLGQLRSSLVHNRNEIRKLTQTLNMLNSSTGVGSTGANVGIGTTGTTGTTDPRTEILNQLATLEQERQRLRTIIYDNQDAFSFLGWIAKIMTGYQPLQTNDPEETALTNEVQTAIDNAQGTTDTTSPPVPTTTAPTTTTTN